MTDAPPVVVRAPEPEPAGAADDVRAADLAPVIRPRSEWVLLGVGVAMLAVAAWLFSIAVELATRYSGVGPTLGAQTRALAANTLPGPLLVAGCTAICLWFVLQAVRPRP